VRAGATGSIEVSGKVSDQSGNGVANVSITADSPGTTTVEFGPSTTASDGSYTLFVDAGTYDFHFDPPSGSNLTPVIDSNILVLNTQTINIQFAPATHTFSGTMTDQNGNPIHGVNVYLGNELNHVCTDSSGHFSLTANAGSYTLGVAWEKNGYNCGVSFFNTNDDSFFFLESASKIDLTNSDVTQNIQLKTATLTITFKDANGNPIPNTTVLERPFGGSTTLFANEPTNPSSSELSNEGITDSTGTVQLLAFQGLTFGQTYGATSTNDNLCALPSSGAVCIASPLTISGDTSVNITAPVTHIFSGTVTDQNGNPIQGINVSLDSELHHVCTDANGHYSLTVNAGSYTPEVFWEKNGSNCGVSFFNTNDDSYFFLKGTTGVDLTNSDVTQNIQLKTATLTVTLKDANGNPVPNTMVLEDPFGGSTTLFANEPTNPSSSELSNEGVTDSTGTVRLLAFQGLTFGQTYGVSSSNDNLCALPSSGAVCIASALTVNGSTSVVLQQLPPTPSAPTNLTVATPTQNPALSWSAASGATSYNVYRNGSLIDSITTSNATSYTDFLAPEGNNTYFVTAVNAGGESSHSNSVQVLVDRTPPTLSMPVWINNPMTTTQTASVTVTATENLSGVAKGEYYLGTTDPGQGNGTAMTLTGSAPTYSLAASFSNLSVGVYTVNFRAENNTGIWSPVSTDYLAVYNPTSRGLFTGADNFNSPTGADTANPALTGKVTFGISTKYDTNNQPTGTVKMDFKAGNINFVATNLTVLVTDPTSGLATLRGAGTVNGSGSYTVLMTGIDSSQTNGGVIRFQIKDASGNVVYDTQPGSVDTATPTTTVNGHIVVH